MPAKIPEVQGDDPAGPSNEPGAAHGAAGDWRGRKESGLGGSETLTNVGDVLVSGGGGVEDGDRATAGSEFEVIGVHLGDSTDTLNKEAPGAEEDEEEEHAEGATLGDPINPRPGGADTKGKPVTDAEGGVETVVGREEPGGVGPALRGRRKGGPGEQYQRP